MAKMEEESKKEFEKMKNKYLHRDQAEKQAIKELTI